MSSDEASRAESLQDAAEADLAFDRASRLKKAATAFRTISEVADDLHVPQHVLRFWETRFPQVKPLKRGGGRRYYRPDDVVLLRRISDLLYVQGYTIKGVQRLLVESGGTLQGELSPPDVADCDDGPAVASDAAPTARPLPSAPPRETPPREAPPLEALGRDAASEIAGLRRLLGEILTELEAMRGQMPP